MSSGQYFDHLKVPEGATISFTVDGEYAEQISGVRHQPVRVSYTTKKEHTYYLNHIYAELDARVAQPDAGRASPSFPYDVPENNATLAGYQDAFV